MNCGAAVPAAHCRLEACTTTIRYLATERTAGIKFQSPLGFHAEDAFFPSLMGSGFAGGAFGAGLTEFPAGASGDWSQAGSEQVSTYCGGALCGQPQHQLKLGHGIAGMQMVGRQPPP